MAILDPSDPDITDEGTHHSHRHRHHRKHKVRRKLWKKILMGLIVVAAWAIAFYIWHSLVQDPGARN